MSYQGPAGTYQQPGYGTNYPPPPPGTYPGPPAGAYQGPGYPQGQPAGAYPQTGYPTYQTQPQPTTVYVYKEGKSQAERDQELAEDCCILACCWALVMLLSC
ncbi:hypothetical protein FSP39_008308 [Pinctada imbricata]|uniref:Cysteine-rich and transmembrane domain-containing protein 1 n=1 Tax=Pinctada imbricata TaxID=66713 RepID=A0AA89C0V6_PINIB|nr:hypothetical protein FSP39_008308 [Pinctada imbricata]